MKTLIATAAILASGTTFCGLAMADEPAGSSAYTLPEPSLSFKLQDTVQAKAQQADGGTGSDVENAPKPRQRYGDAGSTWLTLGVGAAFSFEGEDTDFEGFGSWSIFLADSLEFAVELGGWYFDQEGPNTGGVSGSMIFRWHFWMSDDRDWTVYGDVGIGLLGAFDEVPDEGTNFNFLPRAGAGFTRALDDEGTRLMAGVRWHHISNGRINSDASNPSRDSIMIYAGVIFEF